MILEALIQQFRQRFNYEKRAEVCLWFDEAREFHRLLPAIEAHMANLNDPAMRLFAYDPSENRGQIWLRRMHYEHRVSLSEEEREKQRYLFYFPLSEERWNQPDEEGRNHLGFLQEYRYTAVTWRINGKKPTLFSFLRLIGVHLPNVPAQQRKLFDGGNDSLLAKYTARFDDRPAEFWKVPLTPELAQERLLGNLPSMVLRLAVNPDTVWSDLEANGLLDDFLNAVTEKYGFTTDAESPVIWLTGFVEMLGLSEAFLNYGEPEDFPFLSRLPLPAKREAQGALLRQWLRDAEARPAWDQWVAQVEKNINLSGWAKTRKGAAYGFPHLVELRWNQFIGQLDSVAYKKSDVQQFVVEEGSRIKSETEYAKASFGQRERWDLLSAVCGFVAAVERGAIEVEKAASAKDAAQVYVRFAESIDRAYWRIKAEAMDRGVNSVCDIADRSYADYANALNQRFFEYYSMDADQKIDSIPEVTAFVDAQVWKVNGKRAVIIVDGFRYDCAMDLRARLNAGDVTVTPVRAVLPTRTAMGMSALLPLSLQPDALEVKSGDLHPKRGSLDLAVRENRLKLLREFGADIFEIDELAAMEKPPNPKTNLLVVFGHETLDGMGHLNSLLLIRHMAEEVERLARVIRKLHSLGVPEVHVVTDHGFVLIPENFLPQEVNCEKDWCVLKKERFALVPTKVEIPLTTKIFPWDKSMHVAIPPGLAFFKAEKAFSHGGASLQELIIPHVVSRVALKTLPLSIGVELPAYQLNRAVAKVTLRTKFPGGASGQMDLFAEASRTLLISVKRKLTGEDVLPGNKMKEVSVKASDVGKTVSLFFDSKHRFLEGEQLLLKIQDRDSGEEFPAGGITLTIERDL